MDNLKNTSSKNYLTYSLITYFCLIIIIFTAFLIEKNYNPSLQEGLNVAKETLINPSGAQPEPKEKMMFFGSIAVCLFSIFIFNKIITKQLLNFSPKILKLTESYAY